MFGSRTRVRGKTKSKTLAIFCVWVRVGACGCAYSPTQRVLPDSLQSSPPGSSVHGSLQARLLEWVALPPPGNLPSPGTELASLAFTGKFLTTEPPTKPGDFLRWTLSRGHELHYPATPQHNSRAESMSPIIGRSLPKSLWERLKLTHTPT